MQRDRQPRPFSIRPPRSGSGPRRTKTPWEAVKSIFSMRGEGRRGSPCKTRLTRIGSAIPPKRTLTLLESHQFRMFRCLMLLPRKRSCPDSPQTLMGSACQWPRPLESGFTLKWALLRLVEAVGRCWLRGQKEVRVKAFKNSLSALVTLVILLLYASAMT